MFAVLPPPGSAPTALVGSALAGHIEDLLQLRPQITDVAKRDGGRHAQASQSPASSPSCPIPPLMRFRLLGPLTVGSGEDPLTIRGNRLRAVLALLLLNSGKVVPMGHIIKAVWGEAPPRTVRTQVQAQISALRAMFQNSGVVKIHTHPAGYSLHAQPGEIDVLVFDQLVQRGRALSAGRQFDSAVALFREALKLYHGPPLCNVDAPFARLAGVQLQEQRLDVLGDLFGLELRLGRHREIISTLTELVAEHPLRETFWRHLVVALHGAGRRGEAIAVYHRVRRLLRDELGLDPGRDLVAAYRDLLEDEPTTLSSVDREALAATLDYLRLTEQMLRDVRRQLEAMSVSLAGAC
ncbi:BTAD domain-containing putative transcriptional regulator [Micromonospora sp. NPDC006431]|uniref:AfsR/SARP family transcriptional regulator n=1 Tax=Micromonospora sp. NPDC006431 TaxID=3364235 RepID=UPI0036C52745